MRSLYTKLALVLATLFCAIGGVFLAISVYSAHLYQQEVSQRLNRDLAAYVVREKQLNTRRALDHAALEDVFHMLMVINPSVELYLLDAGGRVLAYSGASDRLQRPTVATEPIEQFLSGTLALPILGEDPRSGGARKVFSAAPIEIDGERRGYIYAILGSEQMEGISQMLDTSYILGLSTFGVAAALLFGLLTSLIVFALLTRRLTSLSQAMDRFEQSDFSEPVALPAPRPRGQDEIDRLSRTFIAMAARIRAQVEALRHTDAQRRELVANVSHDLRTPLASLQGYLETLQVKQEQLSDEQQRAYLATATRHAAQLGRLIDELFELARLESLAAQPHTEPFSLTELVHDVVQKFQLRAERAGVSLHAECASRSLFAHADIAMIERVLDNLIENALRHTPHGGEVRVVVSPEAQAATIRVIDTGRGIPAVDLPFVFERFYRIGDEKGHAGPGGLGLAIAWRIVELHGQKLSVHSRADQGTEFDFRLPLTGQAA